MSEDKPIRKGWGTDEEYYKELETFYKQHEGATVITYSNEFNCPVKAEYYFRPYHVHLEKLQLLSKLGEAIEELEE